MYRRGIGIQQWAYYDEIFTYNSSLNTWNITGRLREPRAWHVVAQIADVSQVCPSTPQCGYQRHSEKVELPPKLEVVWLHFIDKITRACNSTLPTNDWNGCSDSVEKNIGMTPEQFYQEAPCKAGDFYKKTGMTGFSGDLYIGYVFGRYNHLALNQRIPLSVGSKNESALADEFVVFYKNMTLPETCKWFSKLPQGFSCGKVAPPDRTCGRSTFDTFRPVPCSEIEVKVLDSKAGTCPRREDKDKYNSISRPSQPDCWASVNWT